MTTVGQAIAVESDAVATAESGRWQRLDEWLARTGERFNPILVKETRQALKSRQFLLTFVLVLAACWIWTFLGLSIVGPSVAYQAAGTVLFIGYFVILAFPLTVIIPYTAFRSLSAESEENTFDLLSITTLSPRQIVSGKLGSAAMQVLVYLSAVAPCLAFTYLLRGIDVVTISVVLLYAFFGSLGLSACCLFLATLTREKFGQIVLSVVVIVGLFLAFLMVFGFISEFMSWNYLVAADSDFWIFTAALFTWYATTFAIIFLAAAARLTFESENRSTPLRVAMLVQYLSFIAWMAWPILAYQSSNDIYAVVLCIVGAYWYGMGTMMTTERPIVSMRVRRRLPQSFLGRMLFTFFNPGPGAGYLFAIGNTLAACVLLSLALVIGGWSSLVVSGTAAPFPVPTFARLWPLAIVLVSYLVIFLGVGRLVIAWLRRFTPVHMFVGVGMHVILLSLATAVPLVVQFSTYQFYSSGYSMLQISNPFWTLAEIGDGPTMPLELPLFLIMLPTTAFLVFLANWKSIAGELRHVRVVPPARLVEEEAAEHPTVAAVRTSPWD